MLVEADLGRDGAGEQGEAARDEAGIGAVGAHGLDERPAARGQGDARLDDLVDHVDGQVLEQRHALAQSRLEGDLAAHGALGDLGDFLLQPDIIRQLVDAFLADHGGIHVRQEQALAPGRQRLHHDVDGLAIERRTQSCLDRLGLTGCLRRTGRLRFPLPEPSVPSLVRATRPPIATISSVTTGRDGLAIRVATREFREGAIGKPGCEWG